MFPFFNFRLVSLLPLAQSLAFLAETEQSPIQRSPREMLSPAHSLCLASPLACLGAAVSVSGCVNVQVLAPIEPGKAHGVQGQRGPSSSMSSAAGPMGSQPGPCGAGVAAAQETGPASIGARP